MHRGSLASHELASQPPTNGTNQPTCTLDLPDEHETGLCEECEGGGYTLTGWALVAYAA